MSPKWQGSINAPSKRIEKSGSEAQTSSSILPQYNHDGLGSALADHLDHFQIGPLFEFETSVLFEMKDWSRSGEIYYCMKCGPYLIRRRRKDAQFLLGPVGFHLMCATKPQ